MMSRASPIGGLWISRGCPRPADDILIMRGKKTTAASLAKNVVNFCKQEAAGGKPRVSLSPPYFDSLQPAPPVPVFSNGLAQDDLFRDQENSRQNWLEVVGKTAKVHDADVLTWIFLLHYQERWYIFAEMTFEPV